MLSLHVITLGDVPVSGRIVPVQEFDSLSLDLANIDDRLKQCITALDNYSADSASSQMLSIYKSLLSDDSFIERLKTSIDQSGRCEDGLLQFYETYILGKVDYRVAIEIHGLLNFIVSGSLQKEDLPSNPLVPCNSPTLYDVFGFDLSQIQGAIFINSDVDHHATRLLVSLNKPVALTTVNSPELLKRLFSFQRATISANRVLFN